MPLHWWNGRWSTRNAAQTGWRSDSLYKTNSRRNYISQWSARVSVTPWCWIVCDILKYNKLATSPVIAFPSLTLSTTNSLARSIGNIMSAGLFFQLLVCAVSLAVYMFGIETNQTFGMQFVSSIIGLFSLVASTYFYCFFSEKYTSDLGQIAFNFYQFAWYRLPPRQQKYFVMPIQRAHKELRLTGLGLVECSLKIFASVMKWLNWTYAHANCYHLLSSPKLEPCSPPYRLFRLLDRIFL